MSDDLSRLLRALPADEPGPRFTAAVVARLDAAAAGTAPARRVPRWAAVAAVVTLTAGVWGAVSVREALGERRKAALRRESVALAADLAALRAEAAAPAPLLYLGGSEEVDVVLDLSTLPVAAAVRMPAAGSGTLD